MTPDWSEMTRVFGRIGVLSFGGPAAQIALMQRELVDERPWLTQERFQRALGFCMILPGPEAMQLATFCGWRLRGTGGALLAGLLFVVPGAVAIFALALLYLSYGDLPTVEAAFLGIKAAVVVVVVQALAKVARKALTDTSGRVIAVLAFVAIFALDAPFPSILAAAALWGALATEGPGAPAEGPAASMRDMARTSAMWGAIWLIPLVVLSLAGAERLAAVGWFFAKLAVLTFGGAYAVLAWMAQEVVEDRGWLTPDQMIDALGLAETTPGPLILVTQFVGALANGPGAWGLLAGGLVALHATFAPCFLWILVGAPWLERLTAQPRLAGALRGVTAAVAGVIADLSLWFALHVVFGGVGRLEAGPLSMPWPEWGTLDPAAAGLSALAAGLILPNRLPLIAALGIMAFAGLATAALR
ncbi:chromate transporter [Hasllibacter halocynthiae]|uniref:Chromate transporter n=1 Tax=Hasllibacter halocynthiae TaxID=595589 RepID=A0A2T0X7U3_9RHOB|nr:chromate efflux transporter [Hasllibacter halocynthiae]PRY94997.1 chromate transporter [Hasllibacter halocynthiae]